MYLPCLETHIYSAYFQKVPTVGEGFPPSPARSLRSLAHILQAPRSPPPQTVTLEPRLVSWVTAKQASVKELNFLDRVLKAGLT